MPISVWPAAERVRVNDIMSVTETAAQFVDSFDGLARAFLQVQNGCDHRCTFCIIPYGRGNSRSVPMGAVIGEARRLVEAGFPELVLTGVDLTSYGADLPGTPSLGQLVRKILKLVPELKRLRISSIDSIEADDTLLRMIAEDERLMPHFHLSVQAGDDMILKRMKRRHSRRHTIEFCETVRRLRPDAVFGADLIAGFPDRDRRRWPKTRSALWTRPGSPICMSSPSAPDRERRPPACPNLPRDLVKARAARLARKGRGGAGRRILPHASAAMQTVLVEQTGLGRTPDFAPVRFSGMAAQATFLRLRIDRRQHAQHLIGMP